MCYNLHNIQNIAVWFFGPERVWKGLVTNINKNLMENAQESILK